MLTKSKQSALEHFNAGRLVQAKELFEQCAEKHKDDFESWFLLGTTYQLLADHQKAIVALEKATSLKYDHPESYYVLANALYDLGRFNEAAVQYQHALKCNPEHVGSLINLGNCCNRKGRPDEAIQCFNRALQLSPDNVSVYNSLGNTLKTLGHARQAIEAFNIGLRLDPENINLIMNLGLLVLESGNVKLAKQLFFRAIQLKPDLAEAYNNLGNIMKNEGSYQEAGVLLEKALLYKPGFVEALHNLAATLFEAGHFREAEKRFQEVITLDPDFVASETAIVAAKKRQGKYNEALNCLKELARKYPDDMEIVVSEVDTLEKMGDFSSAIRIITKAFENNKTSLEINTQMVRLCHKAGNCETAIRALEDALAGAHNYHSQKPRINGYFALGKSYDRKHQYDKAFENYHMGNSLKQGDFDRDEFRGRVDNLIRDYSSHYFSQQYPVISESERPVFIVGMPRSGTSLLEQILSSHPDIAGAGELEDIGWFNETLIKRFNTALPEDGNEALVIRMRKMATDYLGRLAEVSEKTRFVTDKMPQNFLQLGFVATLFPRAHIIHIQRDPVDTCLSCYFQDFAGRHLYSHDLADCGYYYTQYQRLMQHWHEVLPISIHNVVYEDIVADMEQKTRQLLAYLGLEWDQNCLNFHQSQRHVLTASYDQVRQPVYHSSISRWKNYEKYLDPLLTELRLSPINLSVNQ